MLQLNRSEKHTIFELALQKKILSIASTLIAILAIASTHIAILMEL